MINCCPICKSRQISFRHKIFSFPVVVCRKCGFVKATNNPDDEELKKYYSVYSYSEDLGVDQFTIKRYNEILDMIEPFRSSNRILDFGCGTGHFLEAAHKRNWDVTGIEFSKKAIEVLNAKGINAVNAADREIISEGFDAVVCIEVIEHVTDPVDIISYFQRILRPGGCIYITTPNIKNISLKFMKDRSFFITWPEHLNYFTIKSIRTLLESGYNVKSIRTTGIVPFWKGAKNKTIIDFKEVEKSKIQIERRYYFRSLKFIINWVLNLFKIGDTIKLFAVKRQ